MNTPLPMIIAGATMAQADILKAIKNMRTLRLSFYRLVLIPLVCAIILKPFNLSEIIYTVTVIASACPVATTTILLAVKYDKDDSYASELFSLTTLFAVISMPIILMIIKLF